jgi:hypothetical protein
MRGKEYAVVTTGMRRGQPAPLRLTQRGRVVVLAFFILLASLASAVLWTTASRADDPPSGAAPTVVVEPGDTLWSIASRTSSGGGDNLRAVIAEIRALNGLGDSFIQPGEILTLPRER